MACTVIYGTSPLCLTHAQIQRGPVPFLFLYLCKFGFSPGINQAKYQTVNFSDPLLTIALDTSLMSAYLEVIRKLIIVPAQTNNQRKGSSYFVAASSSAERIKLNPHKPWSRPIGALRIDHM